MEERSIIDRTHIVTKEAFIINKVRESHEPNTLQNLLLILKEEATDSKIDYDIEYYSELINKLNNNTNNDMIIMLKKFDESWYNTLLPDLQPYFIDLIEVFLKQR